MDNNKPESEKLYRVDITPTFRVIDPDCPLQKDHAERMQQYYRNMKMSQEYDARYQSRSILIYVAAYLAAMTMLAAIAFVYQSL